MNILRSIWGYLVALGVGVLGLLGIYLAGRRKGKEVEKVNTQTAQAKAAVAEATNVQQTKRDELTTAVERLPDAPAGVPIGDAPPDTAAGRLSDWAD